MGTDWLKFIDPALTLAGGIASGNPLGILGGLVGLGGAAFPRLGGNTTSFMSTLGQDLSLGVPGLFDPSQMGFSGPSQYLPAALQNALGIGSGGGGSAGTNAPSAPFIDPSVAAGGVFNAFNGIVPPQPQMQSQGPTTPTGGTQTGATPTTPSPVSNLGPIGRLYLQYQMAKRLRGPSFVGGHSTPVTQQPPFSPFAQTPAAIQPPQVQL